MEQEPRKRVKRTNTSGDDDAPKVGRRGRPRLNVPEATSKDRRRAQIRLAQRAYRERKEDTITALNRRVASLQSIISDMNDAFSQLESQTNGMDLPHTLREYLRETATQMNAHAARGAHLSVERGSSEEVPTPDPLESVLSARKALTRDPRTPSTPGRTTLDQPLGYDLSNTTNPSLPAPADTSTAPTTTEWRPAGERLYGDGGLQAEYGNFSQPGQQAHVTEPTNTPTRQNMNQALPSSQVTDWGLQPWGSSQDSTQYRVDIPTTTTTSLGSMSSIVPSELPLPQSHAHRESSFARRLLRTSIETSSRLLRDPSSHPQDIHRFGRYAYCFMKRRGMISWFESVLRRSVNDNLEIWKVPTYHIGGAGLHYPREGLDASSHPPANWAGPGRIGPTNLMNAEYALANFWTNCEKVDNAGVGGVWYDSNDVDQYLREKGLCFDTTSKVIEIPDLFDEPPTMVSSNGTSNPESVADPPSPDGSQSFDPVLNQTATQKDKTWMYGGIGGGLGSDLNYMPSGHLDPMLDFGTFTGYDEGAKLKARKLVDVEAFLERIARECTCLGRTLGFRREAIDEALEASTTEVPVTA